MAPALGYRPMGRIVPTEEPEMPEAWSCVDAVVKSLGAEQGSSHHLPTKQIGQPGKLEPSTAGPRGCARSASGGETLAAKTGTVRANRGRW